MTDVVSAFAFLVFSVLATHWVFNGNMVDDLYKVIVSGAVFIVLLNFVRRFKLNERLDKLFQLFGRESLAIYVMQFSLTPVGGVNQHNLYVNPFVLFIVAFVIAIPICYLCSCFSLAIKKNRILGLLFFGQRFR